MICKDLKAIINEKNLPLNFYIKTQTNVYNVNNMCYTICTRWFSVERIYAAIDLKSFFASVECRKRNLDPLTTNLVVADNTRTEKTRCVAISRGLKG